MSTTSDRGAAKNERRVIEISQGFAELHTILLVQPVVAGLSVGVATMVLSDGHGVATVAGYLIGAGMALAVYLRTSQIVTAIIANLVRLVGQPASVRDNKTGRFIPVSSTANRQKKTFIEV